MDFSFYLVEGYYRCEGMEWLNDGLFDGVSWLLTMFYFARILSRTGAYLFLYSGHENRLCQRRIVSPRRRSEDS